MIGGNNMVKIEDTELIRLVREEIRENHFISFDEFYKRYNITSDRQKRLIYYAATDHKRFDNILNLVPLEDMKG